MFATRTRILVAALIGSAAMVAGTSGASAAITSISVNDRASVQLDGAVAVVTGFVQCTAGDTVNVSTTVIQGKGQLFIEGFGNSGAITCTGSLQAWTIVAPLVIGSAYKHGQASSLTQAFDSTEFTSADSVSQTLHMGN